MSIRSASSPASSATSSSARRRSASVVGQTSGQLVYPKNTTSRPSSGATNRNGSPSRLTSGTASDVDHRRRVARQPDQLPLPPPHRREQHHPTATTPDRDDRFVMTVGSEASPRRLDVGDDRGDVVVAEVVRRHADVEAVDDLGVGIGDREREVRLVGDDRRAVVERHRRTGETLPVGADATAALAVAARCNRCRRRCLARRRLVRRRRHRRTPNRRRTHRPRRRGRPTGPATGRVERRESPGTGIRTSLAIIGRAPLTGMTSATTPSTRSELASIDAERGVHRGRRPVEVAGPPRPDRRTECRRPATARPRTATGRPAPSAPTARCRRRDATPTPRRTATTAPTASACTASRSPSASAAAPPPPARRARVDPSGSTTHSITLVWLATAPSAPRTGVPTPASARRAATRRDAAGRNVRWLNVTGRSPHHSRFGIDQPTRDEPWSDVVVADRRHHAVVLVAEVGGERRPVARRPAMP